MNGRRSTPEDLVEQTTVPSMQPTPATALDRILRLCILLATWVTKPSPPLLCSWPGAAPASTTFPRQPIYVAGGLVALLPMPHCNRRMSGATTPLGFGRRPWGRSSMQSSVLSSPILACASISGRNVLKPIESARAQMSGCRDDILMHERVDATWQVNDPIQI